MGAMIITIGDNVKVVYVGTSPSGAAYTYAGMSGVVMEFSSGLKKPEARIKTKHGRSLWIPQMNLKPLP